MQARILGGAECFVKQNIRGHDLDYFVGRDFFLDCRWPGAITIDPSAHFGQSISLVVGSHDPSPGAFGRVTWRPLVIGPRVQVYSFAILYNCEIGADAVVALGAVVRSRNVPPGCMVEGNPARIIKRLQEGRWVAVAEEALPVRKA